PPALELECELTADGDEQALAQIVAALREERGFAPESRSKLARALQGVALPAATRAALSGDPPVAPEAAAGARQGAAEGQQGASEVDGAAAPTPARNGAATALGEPDGDRHSAVPAERRAGHAVEPPASAVPGAAAPNASSPADAEFATPDDPAAAIALALAEATPTVPPGRGDRVRGALALFA